MWLPALALALLAQQEPERPPAPPSPEFVSLVPS
jgi:hypothetical protein